MKKVTLFFFLILLSSGAYNQDSIFVIGLEAGPTITRLTGNSTVDGYDSRISFTTGLFIEYHITKQISLKSGLGFERKGTQTKIQMTDQDGDPAGNQNVYVNMDYIVLPILGSYATKGKIKFYVNAGPYIAYLLSSREIYESVDGIEGFTIDQTDNTKKIDSGLLLGLGFIFPIKKKLIFDIGLRENVGLINTSKTEVIGNGSIKTMSLGLIFGLKFKL